MNTNRRRPGGYHGQPRTILKQILEDERAALSYMRELRRRAEAGENVWAEIDAEGDDALLRMMQANRIAGPGDSDLMVQICHANAEGSSERMYIVGLSRGISMPCLDEPERAPLWVMDAACFIARHAGMVLDPHAVLEDAALARRAYRAAAKRLHPDVGGDTRMMQDLEAAHRVLAAHLN